MKKAISLYVAVMLGVVVFAQDTTAGKNNFPPNNINRDTVPGNNSWNKKDSNFNSNGQWPKDSVNKKTWPNTDSTLQHSGNMRTDSANSTYQPGSQAGGTTDTSSLNKQSTAANDNKASDTNVTLTDRVMMKDDKMVIVKNNELSPLDKDYKLESGAVVTTDGMVKYPGGKSVQLKNGQFIELAPATETSETKKTTHKKTSAKSTTTKKKKTPNS
jgi:hypothetical protein